ncbi:hydrolase [Vibrio phage D480]
MKGYVFVNRYCKGIQAGIQGAHALLRLSGSENREEFDKWLQKYETICILSAASSTHLAEISVELEDMDNAVEDVAVFKEEGLNDAITAVAFIGTELLIQVQAEMKEWRDLRKIGEGPNRRIFDSDMHYKYGQTYQLAKFLEGFRSHDG